MFIHIVDAMAHLEAARFPDYSAHFIRLLESESKTSEYRKMISSIKLRILQNAISRNENHEKLQT